MVSLCQIKKGLGSYYELVAAGRKQADHTDWEPYRLVGLDASLDASSYVLLDQDLDSRLVAATVHRMAAALHQDTYPSGG